MNTKLIALVLLTNFYIAHAYSYSYTVINKFGGGKVTIDLAACLNSNLSPRPNIEFNLKTYGEQQTIDVGACCAAYGGKGAVKVDGKDPVYNEIGNPCGTHTIEVMGMGARGIGLQVD
jgi:hypothetical protein